MRHISLYHSPFRIHHRPPGVAEPDYGPKLSQKVVLSRTGPLHAQGPGDLTRWMGLPWQADTAYCRSGYDRTYDPFIPTFWPAHVPNQVLTEAAYQVAVDRSKKPEERLAAFTGRYSWNDPLGPNDATAAQMEAMVRLFGDMGLVEVREGATDVPGLPPVMRVASFGPGIPDPPAPSTAEAVLKAPSGLRRDELLDQRVLAESSWGSDEARESAPLPVRYPANG
jgi:hypothetical protein